MDITFVDCYFLGKAGRIDDTASSSPVVIRGGCFIDGVLQSVLAPAPASGKDVTPWRNGPGTPASGAPLPTE
jgi:hypothetical protein